MPDRGTEGEREAALGAFLESARGLIHQMRATEAPAPVLAEARRALDHATEILRPFAHPGPFAQSTLDGQAGPRAETADLASLMPYSPIIGACNPIAPPVKLTFRDGAIHGRVEFPATWAGPSDCAHGGMIAATFDELLAGVNVANQLGAMTGTLTVRYRHPTPLRREISMEAHSTGTEGRKVFAHGEMRDGDRVTAEAEGVFIRRIPDS